MKGEEKATSRIRYFNHDQLSDARQWVEEQ